MPSSRLLSTRRGSISGCRTDRRNSPPCIQCAPASPAICKSISDSTPSTTTIDASSLASRTRPRSLRTPVSDARRRIELSIFTISGSRNSILDDKPNPAPKSSIATRHFRCLNRLRKRRVWFGTHFARSDISIVNRHATSGNFSREINNGSHHLVSTALFPEMFTPSAKSGLLAKLAIAISTT